MIENNRDEVCRQWDVLADEDHTHHLSEEEYLYYRQNWWISLNKSGDKGPMRKRSDFNQVLSTLESLHEEDGVEEPAPTGRTNNGSRHRVRPLHGGVATLLVVLFRNSKVKEEASKVLGRNGGARC